MASSSAAATPSSPVRVVAVHLLDAAGQLLRVLFLDPEGHITSQPWVMEQQRALVLASNQRRFLGAQADVRVF